MYTSIGNVSIIVALLKAHGIRHLVLSAGTRHVPLAHSVENDDFFTCYSVVDERSAAYFALGLAKELREPVAVACTSSTATCNYLPAVSEAYYQHVPLLVLTGDRDPYLLDQLEDQMINQVDMYRNFIRRSVTLPVVSTEREAIYAQRLVNDALLELRRGCGGPVQINFPINQTLAEIADASAPQLPEVKVIRRIGHESPKAEWLAARDALAAAKRILVICGSALPAKKEEREAAERFFDAYNCVLCTEHLSNLDTRGCVNTYLLAEAFTGEVVRTIIKPDLVIFFGGNYVSRWKNMLKYQKAVCASWQLSADGEIKDPFQNLTHVFACSPRYFFDWMAEHAQGNANDMAVYDTVRLLADGLRIPDMRTVTAIANQYISKELKGKPGAPEQIDSEYLSGFAAIFGLSREIPEGSLLHLSILNSTRIMQMFPLRKDVAVYSNIGTDGIDGSMSTFLGQAAATDRPCYLVIGDLSFFYDMNAAAMRAVGRNVHILLINNGGGAEFYFSMGPGMLPQIDRHIAAAHTRSAKAWAQDCGFSYRSARTLGEYEEQISAFAAQEGPVLMEVFTDKLSDVTILKGFTRSIQIRTGAGSLAAKVENIPVLRQALETEAGRQIKDKIKTNLKKLF
ncbi:MAG: 2-succinyl-5-enolpyruvyl-6-hydroxy-3-cyclohexene-1-carboxylic-acid synthase [Clostridia bacterium]|nr:2-succinyl-5-enolpyruvyl-6-hydroxy-3-cyclohexene-1-carboxylic-acid synthase [Clostridia bacterium]